MFAEKKVLAIIPARGGSKGIKNKNITHLVDKPLIAYTIQEALDSKYIDDVVVSTDDERIAEVAKQYGAKIPFMRPAELASDTAKTVDAVIHALDELKKQGMVYDAVVLLQPTQPLRKSEDIDKSIELFYQKNEISLVSVSLVDEHPLLIRTISGDDKLVNLLEYNSTCRRQDMPKYYYVNGCIYINKVTEINETLSFNDNKIPYIMPKERAVDIDEPRDLLLAEFFIKNNKYC